MIDVTVVVAFDAGSGLVDWFGRESFLENKSFASAANLLDDVDEVLCRWLATATSARLF